MHLSSLGSSLQGIFDVFPERLMAMLKYGDRGSSLASPSARNLQELLAKIKICLEEFTSSLSTLAIRYSELEKCTYKRMPLAFLWCR